MLPKSSSRAVTVNVLARPAAVGVKNPATTRVLAAAGPTKIPVWVPVIEEVSVSVAVRDWELAVFNVAPKVCMPLSPATKV